MSGRRASDGVRQTTHWEGCENNHLTCAVRRLEEARAKVAALREQLREMRINDACSCRGKPCARCLVTTTEADEALHDTAATAAAHEQRVREEALDRATDAELEAALTRRRTCDECNGSGVYYIDGKPQVCICEAARRAGKEGAE